MDPLTLSTLIGAGQAIGGFAKTLRKRPEYDIPEGAKQALAIAQAQAADPNMPGYSQAKDQIDLATANALDVARQTGAAAYGTQAAVAQAQAANRELAGMNETAQRADIQNLQGAQMAMADRQDLQFQMNKFAPYADAVQEGRDMFGAGLENIVNSQTLSAFMGSPANSTAGVEPSAGVSTGGEEDEMQKFFRGFLQYQNRGI